jgi:hypothetical protein
MSTPMNHTRPLALAAALLLFPCMASTPLKADADTNQPSAGSSDAATEYKMITGNKQAFNDDLQLHFSKGWRPVGGVSVTTWDNNVYFAQLISRTPAGQ